MNMILEHPDITYALRTGYPRPVREPRAIKCAYCDKELSGNDKAIDYDGDYVCGDCFLNQLQEDLLIGEIAGKLGFIVKTAEEAAEEMEDDSE